MKAGAMPVAAFTPNLFERRDQQRLLRRRQRAESRLSRERKRNACVAFGGFAAAAIALGFGLYSSLAPGAVPAPKPVDADTAEFYRTRVGHLLLTSVESGYCRELRFNNSSGQVSDGGSYRCFVDNEPMLHPASSRPMRVSDAGARNDAISGFFKKR